MSTRDPSAWLTGLDLAPRWHGRARFGVWLDTFGDGATFAALRAAWHADPDRPGALDVVALAPGPVAPDALSEAVSAHGPPADDLLPDWPPATHDVHTLALDGGRVRLVLAQGDPRLAWRELVARIDAFVLAAPSLDAVGVAKALVRLAAPEATVAAPAATPDFHAALRARGFVADPEGPVTARYRPAFLPSRAPVHRVAEPVADRHAVVIGAGLAGAATAAALARHGWRTTVLDAHADPAQGASGNPAGLFHGIVHPDDGPHARLGRLAAFAAHRAVDRAIDRHGVRGSTAGLLRLAEPGASAAALQRVIERHRLPPSYVQALDPAAASAVAGLPIAVPAWFYPRGGWVHPGGLVQAWLAQAGAHTRFCGGAQVQRIVRERAHWQALDADGQVLAAAEVMVVAGGFDAMHLLGEPDGAATSGDPPGPLSRVRGQLSVAAVPSGLRLPAVPLAGGGYVLPAVDGQLVFGATAQAGDGDPSLRAADHAHNLAQLARLLGRDPAVAWASLGGRTAWRCVTDDRLPWIGAVPAHGAVAGSGGQLRFVSRRPGLHVITGLGSRGIAWSALGGEVLAAAIAGAPSPLPANLLDAVDPARFAARALRRAAGSG